MSWTSTDGLCLRKQCSDSDQKAYFFQLITYLEQPQLLGSGSRQLTNRDPFLQIVVKSFHSLANLKAISYEKKVTNNQWWELNEQHFPWAIVSVDVLKTGINSFTFLVVGARVVVVLIVVVVVVTVVVDLVVVVGLAVVTWIVFCWNLKGEVLLDDKEFSGQFSLLLSLASGTLNSYEDDKCLNRVW